MTSRQRLLYAALIVALMGGVALWRMDLFLQAFHVTMRQLERGGPARWRILGEVVLFGAILLMTLRVVPLRVEPKRDAAVALSATLLGWIVEAWGTRTGVWSYYTGEQPPLWVVPGWTLGALVIGRVAEEVEVRWGGLLEGRRPLVYWGFVFAFTAVFWAFVLPAAPRPSSLAVFLLLLAGLLVRPDPKDAAVLLTGLAYVFIADFWGTTNGCWAYYVQRRVPGGIALGILYGMFLDTALVFASIKAARLALGFDRRQ
ncbi:MAG TPA: hypothetical protein DCM05_07280 [Elusimicrobia bacterium]|nr:hypothetical protein [Elusimicrobiota bacterium]